MKTSLEVFNNGLGVALLEGRRYFPYIKFAYYGFQEIFEKVLMILVGTKYVWTPLKYCNSVPALGTVVVI